MKQKIIAALKTKYQRFGLSNEAVDRIASAKEKTVTKEEEIESAIADAETMELIANELQKSADVERRKHSDIQKSFDEYKKKHPEEGNDPDPDPDPNKEPEWAKKLREQNEALAKRLDAEEAAKKLTATRTAVETRLKAAGCSNPGILKSVLKGFALEKDETEDAAVTRLQAEYNTAFKETFGDGAVPPLGADTFGGTDKAIDSKNKFLREHGLLPDEKK